MEINSYLREISTWLCPPITAVQVQKKEEMRVDISEVIMCKESNVREIWFQQSAT